MPKLNSNCESKISKKQPLTPEQQELIVKNQGLVYMVVNQNRNRFQGVDQDDLIQEGFEGLMHAARKFEPKRGNKFSTFAIPCVLGYMLRARDKASKHPSISLNAPITEDGEDSLQNFIEDQTVPSPDSNVIQISTRTCVRKTIQKLSPKRQKVVNLSFGLNPDQDPGSLKEVAREIGGISHETVRKIKKLALAQLKLAFQEEGLAEAVNY